LILSGNIISDLRISSASITGICIALLPGYAGTRPSQEALLADRLDDEMDQLRQAIFQLEDDYRVPLVLEVLMGYSTKEVGDMMELKLVAVLTRLHWRRLKLEKSVLVNAAPQ